MTTVLLISAVVLLSCVLAQRISDKIGLPSLLLFMVLGMLCGSDGLLGISFQNYELTEQVCSGALIFIMFYGGFCTNWKTARPVAGKAVLLSTAGVVFTAALTWAFCRFALRFSFYESFLVGAVISSTDAASVFSILRSKKLALKYGTASILEIESGSNDPVAYMLTVICLTLMTGEQVSIPYLIFAQVVYGVLAGVLAALAGIWLLGKFQDSLGDSRDLILVIALVLLAYAVPSAVGGNGYLSVYLAGILMGNHRIPNKVPLVHFFDGITGLAQIVIFFLLGLLSFPHRIGQVLLPTLEIAGFLMLVARPLAVFALMGPAGCRFRQCLLISWAGLRGAASIVFAITAMASGAVLESDLFHIVFMISILSVLIQGTLLPRISRGLQMVDDDTDINKTFTDYQEESAMTLMRMQIPRGHNWENQKVSQVGMPTGSLALMIKRGEETIIPRGDTVIQAGDSMILSVPGYEETEEMNLEEVTVDDAHEWRGKTIEQLQLPQEALVVLMKRGTESIIPTGKTRIQAQDILVMYRQGEDQGGE